MPDNSVIKTAKSIIEGHELKVIHLTFGSRQVKAGEKIAKGGRFA
jgi:hypothetical protein